MLGYVGLDCDISYPINTTCAYLQYIQAERQRQGHGEGQAEVLIILELRLPMSFVSSPSHWLHS